MKIGWPRTSVGWWRLIFAAAAAGLSLVLLLQPPPWKVLGAAAAHLRTADYAAAFSWIAAAVNIVIIGGLAVLCPWWARAPRPAPSPSLGARGPVPRWFWPAVLGAVVACSALTVPRLSQSLWDDEETSLQFYVLGRYKREVPAGELRLKEAPWRNTFFLYDTPNNHVFYNVLARLSNTVWRTTRRPAGLQFDEWALRLPAFAAGLGTLVAVALLFWDLGLPGSGVLASWVLALHPWFEKYCAEARGYTLVMFFVCTAVLFWRRGMLSGRWRWWALFALAQALCLWTWPAALPFFVLLNLGTLAMLAWARRIALPRRTILSRWFCCNALAGMALIQVMLPLAPQMKAYLAQAPSGQGGAKWLMDTACYLATGSAWSAGSASAEGRAEIKTASQTAPTIFAMAAVAGLVLLAGGAVRLASRGGVTAVAIMVAAAGAAAIQILESTHAHMFVFAWYLVYLLPLLAGVFAVGVSGLGNFLQRGPWGRVTAPAALLAIFGVFLFVTHPARARGLASPTEAVRDSVLLTRPELDPASPRNRKIITVGITDPAFPYDANLFWARSPRDLLLLCRQADAQNRPLWVNIGHTWLIRENAPQTQAILDDPSFFTDRQTLRSEFPHCDRTVLRYIPGSTREADLSRFLSPGDWQHVRDNAEVVPEKYFAR